MPNPDIPRYFLYGEPPQIADDAFLHLETLDDRSRPAAWRIRPHAHADLHQVFSIGQGRGTVTVEGEETSFAAPCALIVPAGVVHGFVYEAGSVGHVLTISDAFLRGLGRDARALEAVFADVRCLTIADPTRFDAALYSLWQEQALVALAHRAALSAHFTLLLIELARIVEERAFRGPARLRAHTQIIARFRAEIEENYHTDINLKQYCERIGTTLGRLRVACQSVAGTTPRHMIADRAIIEAKRFLHYSNLSISEIAYCLGFQDPAYFSRYFLRVTGSTPSAYRRMK